MGWFTESERALAVGLVVLGIGLIFLTLTLITKNMRLLVANRIERSLNEALAKSGIDWHGDRCPGDGCGSIVIDHYVYLDPAGRVGRSSCP